MEKSIVDIRQYKNDLRAKYKSLRKSMTPEVKAKSDTDILKKFISTKMYKECETVLVYVSTKIEVDTINIIECCLKDGKRVAVPKCIDGTRNMEFYLIKSINDLEVATFSVLEPIVEKCIILENFSNSVCIIPGLAFDMNGYRLGYGKGYYDRFLSGYDGINIGICFCSCTLGNLKHGRYDRRVDYLITEKYIKKIQ